MQSAEEGCRMTKLNLTVDEALATTRAVRRRLDVSRPVPRGVIEECLELALQAPNGSNRNDWRWIVVDEPATVRAIAAEYRAAVELLASGRVPSPRYLAGGKGDDRILSAAQALHEKLDQMPAFLLPLMPGTVEGRSAVEQAAMWGSIVQAGWSFMLALRERGLGSLWATVSTRRTREIFDILGVPQDAYTLVGTFPVAYTLGTGFRPGPRAPLSEVLSYNRF
jgi:nitroreductase